MKAISEREWTFTPNPDQFALQLTSHRIVIDIFPANRKRISIYTNEGEVVYQRTKMIHGMDEAKRFAGRKFMSKTGIEA